MRFKNPRDRDEYRRSLYQEPWDVVPPASEEDEDKDRPATFDQAWRDGYQEGYDQGRRDQWEAEHGDDLLRPDAAEPAPEAT